MSKVQPRTLWSIGPLSEQTGVSFRRLQELLVELEIEPTQIVNGVQQYSGEDLEKIHRHLGREVSRGPLANVEVR